MPYDACDEPIRIWDQCCTKTIKRLSLLCIQELREQLLLVYSRLLDPASLLSHIPLD